MSGGPSGDPQAEVDMSELTVVSMGSAGWNNSFASTEGTHGSRSDSCDNPPAETVACTEPIDDVHQSQTAFEGKIQYYLQQT